MLAIDLGELRMLRRPAPLPSAALRSLRDSGFCAIPNFLSPISTRAVFDDALLCEEAGLPRSAGIGSARGAGKAGAIRQNEAVRRSSMLTLYPPPTNSVGHGDTRDALIQCINAVRTQLETAPELQGLLPPLAPFHTELAYLFYPEGGRYLRHMDVPSRRGGWSPIGRDAEDGGSFSQAALRREISLLLYLNSDWDTAAWGGALRIWESSEAEEHMVDIAPEGGTLVLMRSDRVPHEVLETTRPRHCVVGWLRALRDSSPS